MADIKYTDLSGLERISENIKSILNDKANTHSHPYLPINGGTMEGSIVLPSNVFIDAEDGSTMLGINSGTNMLVGTSSTKLFLRSNGTTTISGNVGIGTTNPSKLLHLYSSSSAYAPMMLLEKNNAYDVRLELANTVDVLRVIQQASGNGFISLNGNHSLNLETSNTVRFTIEGNGNVRIGNSTDNGAKLQVNGNIQVGTNADCSIGYMSGTGYLSLGTPNDEIRISGKKNDVMYVNYAKSHLGYAPTEWRWFKGDNGTTYADFRIGELTTSGIINIIATNRKSNPAETIIKDSAIAQITSIGSGNDALYIGQNSSSLAWLQNAYGGSTSLPSKSYVYPISLQPLGGAVLIGTLTSDNYAKLQVYGRARIHDEIDLYEGDSATRLTEYIYQGISRIYTYNETTERYGKVHIGRSDDTAVVVDGYTGDVAIGAPELDGVTDNYTLRVGGGVSLFETLFLNRDYWNYISVPANAGNLAFNIGGAGIDNTKMALLNNGNVIVGGYTADNTTDKLQVIGSGLVYNKLTIKGSSKTTDSWITFTDANTSEVYSIGIRRPTDTYGLQYRDSSGGFHFILHDGNYTSWTYSKSSIDTKLGERLSTGGGKLTGALNLGDKGELWYLSNNEPYFKNKSNGNYINVGTTGLYWNNTDVFITSGNISSYAITKNSLPSFASYININRDGSTGTLFDASKLGMEIEVYANYAAFKLYNAVGNSIASNHFLLTKDGNVLIRKNQSNDNGSPLQVGGDATFINTTNVYENNSTNRITHYIYQGVGRFYCYDETSGKFKDLYIGKNDSTALTYKADTGNVIVGNGSDNGYTFQVKGGIHTNNLLFVDRGAAAGVLIGVNGNTIDGYSSSTETYQYLHLNHESTGSMSLCNGGGSVCIGSSNVDITKKLEVKGHVALTGYLYMSDNDSVYRPAIDKTGNTLLFGYGQSIANYDVQYLGYNIRLYAGGGYNTYKGIDILANGNVGVGTNTPNCKFEIAGLHSEPNSTTILESSMLAINKKDDDGVFIGFGTTTKGWIQSAYRGTTTTTSVNHTYQLCLNPIGGNVIIGGSSGSGDKLYVNGSAKISSGINTSAITLSWSQPIIFTNQGSGIYNKATIEYSADGLIIERARKEDKSSGDIIPLIISQRGGGTAAKFDANNLIVSGKVSAANGFFQDSDERIKDIISNIDVDIDKLSELRKVYFNFKNDTDQKHIGVIAQDVQVIYPELVSENEEGTLSVAYDKLSVIALDAVDQLNQKNKKLEDRLDKLEELLKSKGII